jgi:RNA polymerase sigma-70 factor (ECF subfamily)
VTDDAGLLSASAAGDTGAFELFMRRHQTLVSRYLQSFTGSSDVDDAVQDTFVAAWRGAAGYRGAGSARAWLYTIARHTVHHQVRRRVDEPAELESIEQLAEQAGWGSLPEVPLEPDAEQWRELLDTAMARLPADEREVLTLRELDGFSGDETAAILQITVAAMKSRLHRARIHLAAVVRTLEPDRRYESARTPRTGATA